MSPFGDPNGSSHVAVDILGVHELQRTFTTRGRASPPDVMPSLERLPKHGQSHDSTSTDSEDYNLVKHLEDLVKR